MTRRLPVLGDLNPSVQRILLGNALSAIGSGLTMPLLIVYLGQVRGLGTAVAGLVVAYVAVVVLVLLGPGGTLVDRFGPRPILMAGLAVEGTGVLLLTQVHSAPSAFAVATVVAAGVAFTWSPQSALLGRLTEPAERERAFGIQFMLMNLGIGLGGIVAAVVVDVSEPSTFTTLYVLDAATYFLYVAVLLTMRGIGTGPQPRAAAPDAETAEAPGGYREVPSDRTLVRVAILALVLLTCGYGSIEVGLPTIVTVNNGLDVSWVAVAYTVNTTTIVVMQLVVLRLIAGRSRTLLLGLVAVLWAASWLVLGVSGLLTTVASIAAVCLSTLVFAVGETLFAPIVPSLVNDLAPDHLRGRYNSVQSLVWSVAGALGPALAAVLLGADLVGAWVGFVVVGCLVSGVLALRLRSHLTPELDGRAGDASGTMPT